MKKIFLFSLSILATGLLSQAQDKGAFIESKAGYYQNTIMRGISEQTETAPKTVKRFKIDLSGRTDLPTDPTQYTQVWHQKPISQGNTGTCWCFSTTSFYESEIKRLSGKEIKLSELYPVYWEYVERARYFVQNRGNMTLGEGSETNAVAKLYTKYGVVPASAYNGLKEGKKIHSHAKMFEELEAYLNGVKARNAWDEEEVVNTVKSILNFYIGEPPAKFLYNGKEYTPQTFLKEETKLIPTDYVDFMSLMSEKYWANSEYKVPDNWWHDKTYHNVPLNDFMALVKGAIKKGFTVSIGGDVSEAGLESEKQVAMIPSFDIPSAAIDENARYFRYANGSTTDDHAMHLCGYKEVNGTTWFLVKDSGAGSRNCGEECKQFGYYFMHEDFIKLKMMTLTLHKDAAKDLLSKF